MPEKFMNILLTNDDGINSEGLQKLADTLRSKTEHRVYVIAPDINRSGISNALSILNGPVKLSKLGDDTWSCSGYPADCVIAAMLGALPEKPDLVLSGINQGVNLGSDLIYSGTAAAARQASLFGVPAVALSLDGGGSYYWDMAARWSVDHLDELVAYWRKDTFVNVNIPNSPGGPMGVFPAWPGVKHYHDTLKVMVSSDTVSWYFLEGGQESAVFEAGSDSDVVSRKYVSISTVHNFPVVQKELCPGAPDYAAVAKRSGE